MSRTLTRRLAWISAVAVVVLIVGLLVQDFQIINTENIGKDASHNVRSSINLVKYGIYSGQPISPEVVPGYRREPLPNFLLAFYLRVANTFSPGLLDNIGRSFSADFLLFIKQFNLIWAALLFLGLWLTSALVFSPLIAAHWLTLPQILLVNRFFVSKSINGMNTELIAGVILIWLGAILVITSRSRSWRWLLVSGSAFGLVALTKATGAYVALPLLPLVALLLSGISKRFWPSLLTVALGFAFTVTPWLMRNQLYFSRPVIAQGGGDVLLIRSVFNQINQQQFGDAFYAYAPRDMRRDLLGPLMGLSDRDFSCEGRLSVFTRDLECDRQALEEERFGDVRSFYQRGKRAVPRNLSLDNDAKKTYALSSFSQHPINALKVSLPIGWRGFWGFRERKWPSIIVNFAAYSALLLAPVFGLIERRASWFMVSITPLALFLFYSIFSHFLPRYSAPLVPSAVICLTMLLVDFFVRLSIYVRPGKASLVSLS